MYCVLQRIPKNTWEMRSNFPMIHFKKSLSNDSIDSKINDIRKQFSGDVLPITRNLNF